MSSSSGLKKRKKKAIPGEKVVLVSGPMEGQVGTVIEQDANDLVLIWLDRGLYARVHEVFTERIERRW